MWDIFIRNRNRRNILTYRKLQRGVNQIYARTVNAVWTFIVVNESIIHYVWAKLCDDQINTNKSIFLIATTEICCRFVKDVCTHSRESYLHAGFPLLEMISISSVYTWVFKMLQLATSSNVFRICLHSCS